MRRITHRATRPAVLLLHADHGQNASASTVGAIGSAQVAAPRCGPRHARWIIALAACLLITSMSAGAQVPSRRQVESRIRPELRIDYLGSPDALQLGGGAVARVSNYIRLGALLGAGTHLRDEGDRLAWRADVIGRFQVDPFRERRWAPYAAAGVSVRGAGGGTEEYLVLLLGLEGPAARGWSPAIEAGLGGGFRTGLVMRRGGPRYR